MLSVRLIAVGILTTASFSTMTFAVENSGSGNSAWAQLEKMGVSSTDGIESFLDEVCKIKATSVVQVRESPADLKLCQDNIQVKIDDAYFFILDQPSGALLQYIDSSGRSEHNNEDKMRAFRCSADDVFAMTASVLRLLGQPQDKDQYKVKLALEDPGRIGESNFGQWEIVRNYSYNNLPCRGRFFRMIVFPEKTSVRVEGFFDYPIVTPGEEPQAPISKDDAISAAKVWFVSSKPAYMAAPTLGSDITPNIQEVIAIPNNCFVLGKDNPDCRSAESQYCWEVPFSWMESSVAANGVLWVSLRKGDVIGGGTTRHRGK
jgi:hypothetical protein